MRSDSCLQGMPSAKLMSSGTTGVSRIPTLHCDGGAGAIRTLGKKTRLILHANGVGIFHFSPA